MNPLPERDESRYSRLRQVESAEPDQSANSWLDGITASELRQADGAQDETCKAPTFAEPATGSDPPSLAPQPLPIGATLHDFEILQVLGKGSFGIVYLARQLSLDRMIALKVTADLGEEGRTLARLEHDHIVQVFAEYVDDAAGQRLLCMQFVPGASLQELIQSLRQQFGPRWQGREYLYALDLHVRHEAKLDTVSLRDRSWLERATAAQTVCWVGARLSQALAHAHANGIVHRDLKPGNILVTPYGRPMLLDFNLSAKFHEVRSDKGLFGGTLIYMAPEHLRAFDPSDPTQVDEVREPADIYSLALVLHELATGVLPFQWEAGGSDWRSTLHKMIRERSGEAPALPAEHSHIFSFTLSKALHPDSAQRYVSAQEFADQLDGCEQHLEAQRQLDHHRSSARKRMHPLLFLTMMSLVPHALGSMVNIAYNLTRIIGDLSEPQQTAFHQTVWIYNLIVYPACVVLALMVVLPVLSVWRKFTQRIYVSSEEVTRARKQLVRFGPLAAGLACLGWFPGGLVFPWLISRLSGTELGGEVQLHFIISFAISGLIAMTYSVLFVEYVVVTVLYPQLWADLREYRRVARSELRPAGSRLWALQLLAGLIPLAAALIVVSLGPEHFDAYRPFRILVTLLILMAIFGFQVASIMVGRLSQSLSILTGHHPGWSDLELRPES